jgi:hypothetical protein
VPDDRRIVLVRSTAAGLGLIDEAELVKSEIIVSAISRLDSDQLDRLTLASADLGAAIAGALADNPGYEALAQCNHAHGPVLGPTTPGVRASNLHGSPMSTPQSRDTIDVARAQPAHTVARPEPALKEG